jgi:hypothetical protein
MEARRDKVRTIRPQNYRTRGGLQHLTDSYAICCMLPLPSATTYRKTKCMINTKLQARKSYLLNTPRRYYRQVKSDHRGTNWKMLYNLPKQYIYIGSFKHYFFTVEIFSLSNASGKLTPVPRYTLKKIGLYYLVAIANLYRSVP